jgi:hypothetical protein
MLTAPAIVGVTSTVCIRGNRCRPAVWPTALSLYGFGPTNPQGSRPKRAPVAKRVVADSSVGKSQMATSHLRERGHPLRDAAMEKRKTEQKFLADLVSGSEI